MEKDNIPDITVNVPKLIDQLLNAKVVIERMYVNSGTSEESVKKGTSSNGSRLRDSIQRYCPECQTVTVDNHRWTVTKSCPRCESTLEYLCSKCNSKHYTHIRSLRKHWDNCGLADSTLKGLKQSDFLVKKTETDISKEIIRYCSRCNEVDESCEKSTKKVCQNCDQYSMLYQCRTDKQSAKKNAVLNGSRLKDSVQRYCPECQTVLRDNFGVTVKKSCPRCESILKYLCSKCNSKSYLSYDKLRLHWSYCGLDDFTPKDISRSDFLVEKVEIDFSKEIIRYCPRCNEVDKNCGRWTKKVCRNCDQYLLYQCNKCKAPYTEHAALLYHMRSRCYPSLYGCNQCIFTSPVWQNMRHHVIKIHLRAHSIIEPMTQVLNDKAVLRNSEEPLAKNTVSTTVGVNINVNQIDEEDLAGEINCNDYVQRYCPKCEKTKFARIEDPLEMTCSDCKTAITYLCLKCNEKHYKRYQFLLLHLDTCTGSSDVSDMSKNNIDRTKPKTTDKNETRLILDRSQFIVKEFPSVSTTEKWTRYCPKCGLVTASHNDRRCTCSEKLLYMCKKCKIKCSTVDNMAYHSENHCFPIHQYKCTHCEFTKTSWKKMNIHFRFMHADLPLIKCKLCCYETKHSRRMKSHTKKMHCKIDN